MPLKPPKPPRKRKRRVQKYTTFKVTHTPGPFGQGHFTSSHDPTQALRKQRMGAKSKRKEMQREKLSFRILEQEKKRPHSLFPPERIAAQGEKEVARIAVLDQRERARTRREGLYFIKDAFRGATSSDSRTRQKAAKIIQEEITIMDPQTQAECIRTLFKLAADKDLFVKADAEHALLQIVNEKGRILLLANSPRIEALILKKLMNAFPDDMLKRMARNEKN